MDLLQKSIIYPAPGGVPAAEDGDESAYAGYLIDFLHKFQESCAQNLLVLWESP